MLLKADSEPELRYTDQQVEVGQQLKLDNRPYIVVARTLRPDNPAASKGFVCAAPARASRLAAELASSQPKPLPAS
jgi:hypothetical protein